MSSTDSGRQLPATRTVIMSGMEAGLHLGAQVYISLRGRSLADIALGLAAPDVPMTPETLMLWMSSGKPVTAVAVALLWERGLLDLDAPVARIIPEFAANGKDRITTRHLLTHTGGFRHVPGDTEDGSWEEIVSRVCGAKLEPRWVPGRDAGYHTASSWFMLGEIIRRLDGRSFDLFVRDEILLPLGMDDSWMAMPPDVQHGYRERMGVMHVVDAEDVRPLEVDNPRWRAVPHPGKSMRGPVHDLGRFYEMLLMRGSSNGRRILSAQTVEALTAAHRVGVRDRTFGVAINWGLGFARQTEHHTGHPVPYGFGPHASGRTFGHGGAQSSMAFCDPEHGLVAAWVLNGMTDEPRHQQRNLQMNTAIYEDLGLARE